MSAAAVKALFQSKVSLPRSVCRGRRSLAQIPVGRQVNPSRTMATSSTRSTNDDDASYFESRGDYRAERHLERADLPLYQQQGSLPRLPVPSLEDTITKFLPTALSLAESKAEAASLQAACRSFQHQAAALQERLLQRQADNPDSSWLQHWWNVAGYLQPRDPNVIGVSYFFRLNANNETTTDAVVPLPSSLERAAAVLHATYRYALPIQTGTKDVDTLGRQQLPLCSTQYKFMFGACRIPSVEQDSVRVYRPELTQHAVVAHKGQFYKVPLTNNNNVESGGGGGKPLSQRALLALLHQCVENATEDDVNAMTTVPQLGWLTSSRRDVWADTYHQMLQQNPDMQQALETLQSALVVLCLDDDVFGTDQTSRQQEPLSDRDQALGLWHGNVSHSANRWFDKSIQLVVSKGRLGLIGEHSMADGMPAVGFCDYLVKHGTVNLTDDDDNDDNSSAATAAVEGVTNIFAKPFGTLNADERRDILERIEAARRFMKDRIDSYDLEALHYRGYGSNSIKQMGFSPDGFVQMALQVAGYRLFGEQVGTYESIQTRRFLHGRTETARSVSTASAALVLAMGSTSTLTTETKEQQAEKRALLQQAVDVHAQYCRVASEGMGVDRHFFGLSMLVQDNETAPDLFSHPLFLRSKRWRLSTSTLPNTAPGFGPVEADGVGIGYDLRADSCFFTITAQKENEFVLKMAKLVSEALDELKLVAQVDDAPHSRL